jgi:hypothetical protein
MNIRGVAVVRWSATIVAVAFAVPVVATPEQGLPAIKKQIQAQYAQIGEALKQKDVTLYERLHTPDFSTTTPDGKAHSLAEITTALSGAESPDFEKYAVVVKAIKREGGKVVVNASKQFTLRAIDKDGSHGPKGKSHTATFFTSDHDVWVRQDGKWLIQTWQLKLVDKLLVDGKAVHVPKEMLSKMKAR